MPETMKHRPGRPVPRGHQPAKWELGERGITHSIVMELTGLSRAKVSDSLNGWRKADPKVVDACERLTGLPRDQLFTPEALRDFRLPRRPEAVPT